MSETSTECVVCGMHHTTPLTICPGCDAKARRDLHTISTTWTLTADPTLTPRGEPSRRQGGPQPLPGGTDWQAFRGELRAVLAYWADEHAYRYRLTTPPVSVDAVADWLRNHLDRASRDEGFPRIDAYLTDLARLSRVSRYHSGQSNPPTARLACPAIPEGKAEECGHTIHVEAGGEPNDIIACRACGARWTRLRLEHLALHSSGQAWVDAEAAARYSGMSERHLRRMAERGKVTRSRGLYDVSTLPRASA